MTDKNLTIEEYVEHLNSTESCYVMLDFYEENVDREKKAYPFWFRDETEETALKRALDVIKDDVDTVTVPYLLKKTVTYEIVKKLD